jgi:CheY-like chemotaxis protein
VEAAVKIKSILIVEESNCNRKLIEAFVGKLSPQSVHIAENGQQAVDSFRKNKIGLVLMDMEMPVMDGYTATRIIRSLPEGASIPIIAMSAHTDPAEVKKSLDAGCTAYLEKPFTKEKLIQIILQHAR